MSSSNARKKYAHESPAQHSLRRTLSNRTASNVPDNTTPQHHGHKHGKENREHAKRTSSSTGRASQESEAFKTPTRTVKAAASSLKPGQGTPECYSKVEMCAPTPGRLSRPSYTDEMDNDGFSVTVAVRVRPFNRREDADSDVTRVVSMSGNETTVTSSRGTATNSFCFDHCFWSFDHKSATFADQQTVYKKVGQPLLYSALEGYHTCLFAYGQTGSGKSYTMMGDSEAKGVIPRFCEELFSKVMNPEEENVSYKVEVSFFEIYNEKIHDLLCDSSDKDRKKATLRVREHPSLGPYVEGLSVYPVTTFSDISRWIRAGNSQRATAATGMNDASSRSHSVFMIVLTKSKSEKLEDGEHVNGMVSKINLIDLAGSERSSTAQTSGDRLKEGANINKSLMTLGKVISNLSEKSLNPRKKVFIPYRESVLTWLLKESLGGNSKTAMIATISPASTNLEETMSTLRYAKQAESIINIPKVNEDPNAKLVRELRAEIERLRLISKGSYNKQLDLDKIKNTQPNLVNIDENPQNEEVLLYLLKSGKNRIGGEGAESPGEDKNQYCVVESANKLYCVKPGNAFQTLVNGREVRRQTFLNHGDRLIVGNSYFRFNHPEEVRKKRKRKATAGTSEEVGGFKYARNEIIEEQRKRMEDEVGKLRKEMEAEMEKKVKSAKESFHLEANQRNQDSQKRIEDLTSQVSNYQEQLLNVQDQKKDLEIRSSSLLQEKAKLLQQLQNVKNVLQSTLLPVIGVPSRPSPYQRHQSRILQELETEKERVTQIVNNLSKKRGHRPFTDSPAPKKPRNDVEEGVASSAVQTACLRHLKYDKKATVESPNILDDILMELGKLFSRVHRLKSEGDLSSSLDASFVEITSCCDVLLSLLAVFCNMMSREKLSLATAVKDASAKLKQQLSQFLESLQQGRKEATEQSHTKIGQTATFICKLTGEMNARSGQCIKILRREENESCHWSLKQAVVTGGDAAVDQELQSGLQEMTELASTLKEKMKRHGSEEWTAAVECTVQVAKCFAILLNKCQETQFELGSVLAFEESRDSSFYLQSYERTLSVIVNVQQGTQEMKKIAKLILTGLNANNNTSRVMESTKSLYASLSTIGFSASTSNLIPSNSQNSSLSASSLESSSSSSSQTYKPSELAFLASRQAMAACRALQRTLGGEGGSDDEDEVFVDAPEFGRHVHFQEPTSKDVLLVTRYSYNQNEVGTSIN